MKKFSRLSLFFLLIPTVPFGAAVCFRSVTLCILSILSIPLVLRLIPGLSGHANIWAFLLVTPDIILVNLKIGIFLIRLLDVRSGEYPFLPLLWLTAVQFVLFPFWQLMYGFLIRLLFPRQKTIRAKSR